MLVSESWLREWVSPKISPVELAERLTLAGLEVDTIKPAGPILDNKRIVVGQICGVEPHPDADRLKVCKVNAGRSKPLTIVCGARNAREGLKTACATHNSRLPDLVVKTRQIRGVDSQGMLCSAMDLGLDESSGGIMELDADAPIGTGVAQYLDLDDTMIQLELTPNRGDCLGMAGVAREVSTLTGSKLKTLEVNKVRSVVQDSLPVVLDAPQGCPRYVGRAIRNINMSARTPDWMVERLRRSGMRSINPIVDVTNYVMHELGQPMHAFDMDRIAGGIRVRMAQKGEKLKLLDGSTITLDSENLVIADHKNAIALAGIMGGEKSAISGRTTNIYLEAAFFAPDNILGKARNFGMHTDASHRFERGVDYSMQPRAMERATALIVEIAGGEPGPVTHAVEKSALPRRRSIRFQQSEIPRILGISISTRKATRIMQDLGMTVSSGNREWRVKPPSWRFDIAGQHDLVEEVGRCYGFNNIPPRMPAAAQNTGAHREDLVTVYDVKRRMASLGYHEAITYSFVDPVLHSELVGSNSAIRLANPIADNMSVMRQSLWPGLLDAARSNLNRQETRVRLFEIGHIFKRARNSRKSTEINMLAGIVCGAVLPRQWGLVERSADFFDLKGDLEAVLAMAGADVKFSFRPATHPALHPGQCAQVLCGRRRVGFIGKLSPAKQERFDIDTEVYLFEIDLGKLCRTTLPSFNEISRFPSIQRDLALVVDEEVTVDSVLHVVRVSAGDLLHKLELFDVYRGKNLEKYKKSLAFSLTFQSESSNLTSLEVDTLTEKIIEVLKCELGAQLRN